MNKIAELSRNDYLKGMIGSKVKVLTESFSKDIFFGYDEYYISHNVQFHEKKIEKGQFFNTIISSLSKENKGVVSNVL
jgi:threonylcarbamoyladenosine tRNA methylthiotransferase MtaB